MFVDCAQYTRPTNTDEITKKNRKKIDLFARDIVIIMLGLVWIWVWCVCFAFVPEKLVQVVRVCLPVCGMSDRYVCECVSVCWFMEKDVSSFHSGFGLTLYYHKRCKCKFLDKTERTSFVNRNASNNGKSDNKQISIGSENHDLIGIALFGKQRYAPGELSKMNICKRKSRRNELKPWNGSENMDT